MSVSRRQVLGAGAAGLLAGIVGPAGARDGGELERTVAAFASGAALADSGALTLEMPEIAENGYSVGVSVSVDSPMSEADHVEAIVLLAPRNPHLVVATFRFGPASASARAATRIRLAESQSLLALARTSTGALYRTSRAVRVTVGGCHG